jgi:hypothetical protein
MTLRLPAVAALAALGAAGGAPITQLAVAQPTPASHCANGEITVYSCDLGRQVLSVCERYGTVHYRHGPRRRPDLAISSNGRDGRAHQSETTGTGGGYQVQLRFSRGAFSYIVFAGQAAPVRTGGPARSGVAVLRGARRVSTQICPDPAAGQAFEIPSFVPVDGASQEMRPWL